jgi:hypothetical protein
MHKAEQILVQVETLLNQISSLNVERSMFYPIESDQLPRVVISFGGDTVVNNSTNTTVDSSLTLELKVFVDESGGDFETELARHRTDINVKLLTDYTLGLGFIIDIDEGNAAPPEIIEGEKPRAMQVLTYNVLYRRNRINPEL